jgi:hypothetical protein
LSVFGCFSATGASGCPKESETARQKIIACARCAIFPGVLNRFTFIRLLQFKEVEV